MTIRHLTYSFIFIFLIASCAPKKSEKSYLSEVPDKDSLEIFSLIDSANTYRIKGKLDTAKIYIGAAKEHSLELNWGKGIAESYTNLAYINLYENDFEASMENAVEGLRIAEKCNDEKSQGLANLLIGFVYLNLGDTNQVLPYYRKSLELRKKLKNDYDIGYSYSYLGNFYATKQQYDSALFFHEKALNHRLKTEDTRSIADSYLLLGATLVKKKKFDKAIEYYQKALLQYAKINDKKRLAETYRNYGEVFMAQGNIVDAQNFLLQANQLAKETGSIDNLILISDELAEIKYHEKSYKEAYDYLRYHTTTFKATSGEAKYKDIVKNILAYKNEKEKKIKQLEYDQKEERQELVVISIGIVLVLLVGFLIFIFNRLKVAKKQREIIAYRKNQVDKAYSELGIKNKEILDSINYAKRIQAAILPSDSIMESIFEDICILYLPKDIVAGDFYWLEQKEDKILFAAADCTGHGVPGAMVSVVCNNSLNRSVHEYGLTSPAQILDKTRELVIGEFAKSNERMMDGMDIAMCSIHKNHKTSLLQSGQIELEFAGANNPLWIVRKGAAQIEEHKGDKQPIGETDHSKPFRNNHVTLQKGDAIYLFSDGYIDQFGGEKGKKFKSPNLKSLLLSIQNLSMESQRDKLQEAFETWSGDLEQVDDVCIIGVRI